MSIATDSDRELRRLLWLALALMVVLRLAPVLLLVVQPTSDMGWYYRRAIGLVQTGQYGEAGLPTAYWPVGYSGFLAGLMALFGTSVRVGQIANLALSVISALLLYQWCLRQFDSQRVATFAVFLLAVYPNHVGYSIGLYSEPLFTALLLGVCLLARPGAPWWALLATGVLAGLATLVKTQMLLLAPVLIGLLSLRGWRWPAIRSAVARGILATLVMAATIAPWTWRNHVVMGAFIPVSTNGGMSLLAGNNPEMTLSLRSDFAEGGVLFKQVNFSVADQVAADRRARAAAWGWIRENPGTFFALMPKKFFRFWVPDGESDWNLQRGWVDYDKHRTPVRAIRIANQLFYFTLLGGMLFALRHCVNWREPQTLIAPVVFLYFTTVSLVFSGQSRYHAPLMPFVIAYAAWTLARLRPGK